MRIKKSGLVTGVVLLGLRAEAQNTFPTSGNVGIGTTGPQGMLHVYGANQNGGVNPLFKLTDTNTNQNFAIDNGASANDFRILTWGGTTGNLELQAGGNSNQMVLKSSGNIGIGTANPQATLDVAGVVNGRNFSLPGVGGATSWAKIGTFTAAQGGESILITAVLHSGMNAVNSQDSAYIISFKTSNGVSVDGNGFAGNGSWYAIGFNGAIPPGNIKWVANASGVNASAFDLYINLPPWTVGSHYAVSVDQNASWQNSGILAASDPGPAGSTILIPSAEFDLPYGNFGVGTNAPGAKLEVNGNVRLTSGSGASFTFADGTVQSTAWTGSLYGGDYAESVNVSGNRAAYEPGDVLVISGNNSADIAKSSQPYSTLVSGIYSTTPGVVGRRQLTQDKEQEVPMAMVGIVPTKVSAENGSIKRGDLLVTSATEGSAMKGTDPSRMLGAIVGKAMGSLDSGTGVIEVLVSLQ